MKVISKIKYIYSTIILAIMMLAMLSLSFISQKAVYAATDYNDQGYARTITVSQNIPLYTLADGSSDILSCFGYAQNRDLNFVGVDYTTAADDGKTFVYNATGTSSISKGNCLIYQLIYIPENYITAINKGVLTASVTAEFYSPSAGGQDAADKITMTLANLNSRTYSASKNMSLSSFDILDSVNVAETRAASASSTLSGFRVKTTTLALFFGPEFVNCSGWTKNTTMTIKSPVLTLTSTDKVGPTIQLSTSNEAYYKEKTITASISENTSGIKEVNVYRGDANTTNGSVASFEKINTKTFDKYDVMSTSYGFSINENGAYTVEVFDNLGNRSYQVHNETKIDKITPESPLITGIANGDIFYNKQITFQAIFETGDVQADEYYVYTFDGTTPNKDSLALVNGENTFVVEENGPYVLKVLSFDEAGNTNEVQEFDFYVDDNFYNVVVSVSDGVEATSGVEGLRYGNEYVFEYQILDGYEFYYIEINGEVATLENNTKTFTISGNLEIKVYARKIVNVWLNVDTYKYDGSELTLDFSQSYGEKDIVSFKFYIDGTQTVFQEAAEYVVVYTIDTQDCVGTGEFVAKITDKQIAVVSLNKTEYIFDTDGFVLDYTSNVDADDIVFEYLSNGQTIEPKDVGSYTVVYSVNTETYEGSGVLEFAIVQKQIAIEVETPNFVYDGQEKTLVYSNEANANMEIVITQEGVVATALNAGVYNYSITITDKNYFGESVGTFEINRAEPKITLNNVKFVYNGTKQDLGISVQYNVAFSLVLKLDNNIVDSIINVGQYAYEIIVDEQNYYSKLEGIAEVEKRDIIVTAQNYSITYGENIPEFEYKVENAIASDNLVFEFVDYDYTNNAGEYPIKIVEKELDNYNVKYNNATLVISQKTLQVYAPVDIFKYYGESDPEFVVSYDENEVEFDDVLTFSVVRESGENVGDYKISDITINNNNYKLNVISSTFKILKKKIAIKAMSTSKIYGEQDELLEYKITFGELVGDDELSGELSRDAGENVGEYSITLGTLDNTNYEILFLSGKLTILPKQVYVVADAQSITYGEEDCELTYSVEGLIGEDVLNGKLERQKGTDVGQYVIEIGTLANKNYDINFTSANFVIEKRILNVIADAISCIYGEQEKTLTYQISNAAYSDKFDFVLSREQGLNVGEYLISLEAVELKNYTINYVSNIYTINPKPVVLSVVENQGKVFGENEPELKYLVDGKVSVLEGVEISRTQGEDAGLYDIIITAEGLVNYSIIEINNGVFEISKATPIITLQDKTVVYDGETHSLEIEQDFVVKYIYKQNGIEVEKPLNAGEYTVVAVFAGNKNYVQLNSNTAILTIEKQQVNISVEQEYFVYDGKVKMPIFKTNVDCETIVEIFSRYGAQLSNVSDIGVYNYKIVVNSQNYAGIADGMMVIAEKKIYPDGNGNQIEDTQGDFSKNNVVIELKKNGDKNNATSLNNVLEEKYLHSAYYFDVIGELPQNTKVVVKLDAAEIDDITEFSLYFYNSNYELKEVSYKYIDGKIVFEVSDFGLGIALTRNSSTSMFMLLLFGVFIILTMFITATIAIKIYKFIRVKSVVANSGLEQTITFAKKNKNKKVNKIVKHLDNAEDSKGKTFEDSLEDEKTEVSSNEGVEENNDN